MREELNVLKEERRSGVFRSFHHVDKNSVHKMRHCQRPTTRQQRDTNQAEGQGHAIRFHTNCESDTFRRRGVWETFVQH